jgi:hypothetical protein
VPQAAIAAQVHQAFYVAENFSAHISLDFVSGIDDLPNALQFFVAQIPGLPIKVDPSFEKDLSGRRAADPENVRQCDFDPFGARQIHASDSGQGRTSFERCSAFSVSPDAACGAGYHR